MHTRRETFSLPEYLLFAVVTLAVLCLCVCVGSVQTRCGIRLRVWQRR